MTDAIALMRSGEGNDRCSDCGATEPSWVSLNLCVIVCDVCCSVHRSLGSHVSVMACLRFYDGHIALLEAIRRVGNAYANAVWESELRASSFEKPSPEDST